MNKQKILCRCDRHKNEWLANTRGKNMFKCTKCGDWIKLPQEEAQKVLKKLVEKLHESE